MADRVVLDLLGDRIAAITPAASDFDDVARDPDAHLGGVTIPGLVNAHSHAFHRALRGRTHGGQGTFWTWREEMYRAAQRLDPDRYHRLAVAVFAEMLAAGITCVGEFHYLHHALGGVPYREANVMGEALLAAAADAGIRITLLDACYLTGDVGRPLAGTQLRFGDGTVEQWGRRVSALRPAPHARVGAAIHSVRAVPPRAISGVVAWAAPLEVPLHVHVSEQPAENDACFGQYGRSPVGLLADAGALGPDSTLVHATHLAEADIAVVGGSGSTVCACPTTERDLGDGIAPVARLAAAGSPIAVGSDSHAVIDLCEEARAVELDQRLRGGERGVFDPAELMRAVTVTGHASLGWPEAGQLVPGAPADLVTIRTATPRTAGVAAEEVLFAATAADIDHVVVGGRVVVAGGEHQLLGDVGAGLAGEIAALARQVPQMGQTGEMTRR